MSKSWKTAVICLLVLTVALGGLNAMLLYKLQHKSEAQANQETRGNDKPRSMFSWEDAPYLPATRTDLYTVLSALNITDIYQSFADNALYTEETQSFLTQVNKMGMDVYYLTGKAEWGLDQEGRSVLEAIDKAAVYNKAFAGNGRFRGIVLDVEPYLTDAWKEDKAGTMTTYVEAMKKAYSAASQKGLRVVLCIPNWFDASYLPELETLVAECCDMVAVMNYDRTAEQEAIQTEVELAKKYQKPIECIFEFQAPGKHDLTEEQTYYNAGLSAAQESFDALYEQIGYKQLSFSYHYYQPVREIYQQ